MITPPPESHLRIEMPRTRSLSVRGIALSISLFSGLAGCEPVVIGDVGVCGSGESLCGSVCVDEETDPNHCGACGVACDGTCALGRCLVTLASGQDAPDFIVTDSTNIYWTNENGGTVMKAPLGGGAITTLASGQNEPEFIAANGTSVYWSTVGGQTLVSVPIAGGALTTLSSGQQADGIVVGPSDVYWTTYIDVAVMKTPLGGGMSRTLAPGQSTGFGNGPQGLALDATSLYWTTAGFCTGGECHGVVKKVPLRGGDTVQTLASGQGLPESIAVDSTNVYWTNYNDDTLMMVPKSGGTPTTLASGQGEPDFITVDATDVYWTTGTGGVVAKIPVGGGKITTLATGQQTPRGIAVDDASVYWANNTGGTVIKLSPK